LSEEERMLGLNYIPFAADPVVFATNSDVGVAGLSTGNLQDAYSGKVTNWSQIGGIDLEITVLDREEDEAAKRLLRQKVLGEDFLVTSTAAVLCRENDMVAALSKTPGSLGFVSLGYVKSHGVKLQLLRWNGYSIEDVANYPLVRVLGVVTKPDAPAAVASFMDFLQGPDGANILAKSGYFLPKRATE